MKINVWLPPKYGGTGLYRLEMPHKLLPFDVHFGCDHRIDADIFIASKAHLTQVMPLLPDLKKRGIKCVVDYDDYWVLPPNHILYPNYQKYNTTKYLIDCLRAFDHVICTTDVLANAIRPINKNVTVLENAIDYELDQFRCEDIPFDKVRFGWVGGHCHLADIMLLDGTPQRLSGDFHIILFGHDRQKNSVYDRFGYILSGHGQLIKHGKFNVVAQKPVHEYTKFYNFLDVVLSPLRDDKFNSMKSELKIVEAACFKKAAIVSNVLPYKPFLKEGVNCLTAYNKTDWYKKMTKLIKNPGLVNDLGNRLHDDLHDHFDLRRVNKMREELYVWLAER